MLWHGFFFKKGMLIEITIFVLLSLYQQIRANNDEVQKLAGTYMSEKTLYDFYYLCIAFLQIIFFKASIFIVLYRNCDNFFYFSSATTTFFLVFIVL